MNPRTYLLMALAAASAGVAASEPIESNTQTAAPAAPTPQQS